MQKARSFTLTKIVSSRIKRATALLMSVFLLVSINPASALDANGAGGAAATSAGGRVGQRTLQRGTELDLGSVTANIRLGSNLFRRQPSINVNVGGVEQTFGAGSFVTPAQFVAIKQILN